MGARFPSMKAPELEKIVARHCEFVRQKNGSHRIYRNREGANFTFGFHSGETVGGGLVRKVLTADVLLTLADAMEEVGM